MAGSIPFTVNTNVFVTEFSENILRKTLKKHNWVTIIFTPPTKAQSVRPLLDLSDLSELIYHEQLDCLQDCAFPAVGHFIGENFPNCK